ncbi:hypothetical protein V8C42DRAFT_334514 [Trichoderma barbatum]
MAKAATTCALQGPRVQMSSDCLHPKVRLFKAHGNSGFLLDQADRLRCVTPVKSGMDRLQVLFPCCTCSVLRTFVSMLCPCSRTWPPYLRISGRYACVLDTCANVSPRCDTASKPRQSVVFDPPWRLCVASPHRNGFY